MKKKVYAYYLLVDQGGYYLHDPISVDWVDYGVIEKETEKTYQLGHGRSREGNNKLKYYSKYFREGWSEEANPANCVVNKDLIDKFTIEQKSGARITFNLVYRSFKEYSDEEIINKAKKYLKKVFKRITDNNLVD